MVHEETTAKIKALELAISIKLSSTLKCESLTIVSVIQGRPALVRIGAVLIDKMSQRVVEIASAYIAVEVFIWLDVKSLEKKIFRDLYDKVEPRLDQAKTKLKILCS